MTHLPASDEGLHHNGRTLDLLVFLLLLQKQQQKRKVNIEGSIDEHVYLRVRVHVHVCRRASHRIASVPGCYHHLALLEQQEVFAALPSTVDLLDESGQVLQAAPPLFFQEEQLAGRAGTPEHLRGQNTFFTLNCCGGQWRLDRYLDIDGRYSCNECATSALNISCGSDYPTCLVSSSEDRRHRGLRAKSPGAYPERTVRHTTRTHGAR